MLLIAGLAKTTGAAQTAKDADAVLFHPTKSGPAAKTAGALPDIPWGVWLEDAGAQKIGALLEAGCDFMVYTPASRVAAAPGDEEAGQIIEVTLSIDDGLLRAVNDLPADAVLAADTYEEGGAMTWHHLMLLQHLANLINKPLLAAVPPDATAEELKALWEAGVDGIVVETGAAKPGAVKGLRKAINDLPPRSPRKRGKAEALLPHIGSTGTAEPEEDEEEYEDE
jgi:hypothetical protein